MRHIERLTIWNKPKKADDYINSLTDAFLEMKPGNMLAYRIDLPGDDPLTGLPHPVNAIAATVATRLGGLLVQYPMLPSRGDKHAQRQWIYAIHKPRNAV